MRAMVSHIRLEQTIHDKAGERKYAMCEEAVSYRPRLAPKLVNKAVALSIFLFLRSHRARMPIAEPVMALESTKEWPEVSKAVPKAKTLQRGSKRHHSGFPIWNRMPSSSRLEPLAPVGADVSAAPDGVFPFRP